MFDGLRSKVVKAVGALKENPRLLLRLIVFLWGFGLVAYGVTNLLREALGYGR